MANAVSGQASSASNSLGAAMPLGMGMEEADDVVAVGLGAFFFSDISQRI